MRDELNSLEEKYAEAHRLCFFIHDVMVDFIKGGESNEVFKNQLELNDEEKCNLENFDGHILDWLLTQNKKFEYEMALWKSIIPAVLSDMLHCIYETLRAMETGKVTIAYMMLRKPLQENLYLFEEMLLHKSDFLNILENDPLKFRPKNAGGIEGHQKKITEILGKFTTILDARYIASLRYDKNNEDSFAGCCNQAMHLFTEHKAIKTEKMNINFIFANHDSKKSLYDFMYSRLPYLMYYIYIVFEQVVRLISSTSNSYLLDINRRIAAMFILTTYYVDDNYQTEQYFKLCNFFDHYLQINFKCVLNREVLESIVRNGKVK